MAFQRKIEILGIHVGGDRLYYAHLKRGLLGGWAPKRLIPAFEAWGSFPEANPSGLRRFLSRIPSASGRAIYLALPRHHFFIRNLELPPMSREDALAAVEASLKISAHLPVAEIYYDIHLCPLADRRVHGLLIYARKQDVDPYLEACRTTGHRLELEGISPFILGIGSWLSRQHYSLPLALLLGQGQDRELGVFAKNGTLYSVAATDIESDILRQNVAARYPEVGERFFSFSGSEAKLSELPVPAVDRCFSLPPAAENPAVAALAPVLAGQQPVCVDERPVKLKQVHPLPWLLLMVLVLALLCGGLSWRARVVDRTLQQELSVLNLENKKLKKRLSPLEKRHKLGKKAQVMLKDIDDFLQQQPRFYSLLNDVAERIPDGTWFSSLVYRKRQLTLRGQSSDALKVVESLRESEFFSEVKLRGTVNKSRGQVERFSLVLQLKESNDEKDK
ncbi:MAG: PilN domain-containing protein [Deltaproteobacteria bacterium]|nr:PilN domain-containing protein [Deltaproteobacteria bacterium]